MSDQPNLQQSSQAPKKNVLIMFIIGLPGMGKTTYVNLLTKLFQEKSWILSTLSSDKVRLEIMEQIRKESPELDHQQAFDASSKFIKAKYVEEIEKYLERVQELDTDNHVLFLDRNHPPAIIQDEMEFIKNKDFRSKVNLRILAIKPICIDTYKTPENFYPFSVSFLIKCIQRAAGRENHETLVGDQKKVATIILGFFNQYKDFVLEKEALKVLGIDELIEAPFTGENKEVELRIREEAGQDLAHILRDLKGFAIDQEKLGEFLGRKEVAEVVIDNPDVKQTLKISLENIEKCIKLF